jgi:hypothetical protein
MHIIALNVQGSSSIGMAVLASLIWAVRRRDNFMNESRRAISRLTEREKGSG